MQEILKQNKDYRLIIEKMNEKWWLCLHERSTGECQSIIAETKNKAIDFFKGKELEEIAALCNKMNLYKHKIYKNGI